MENRAECVWLSYGEYCEELHEMGSSVHINVNQLVPAPFLPLSIYPKAAFWSVSNPRAQRFAFRLDIRDFLWFGGGEEGRKKNLNRK